MYLSNCQYLDMSVKMASKTVIRPITQDEKSEGKTLIYYFVFIFSCGPFIRRVRNNGRYFPGEKELLTPAVINSLELSKVVQ